MAKSKERGTIVEIEFKKSVIDQKPIIVVGIAFYLRVVDSMVPG